MAKKIKVTPRLKNYVVFILDKSGSMTSLKNEVVGGFNQNVEEVKKNNKDKGMETKVCLVTFSTFADKPILWLEDVNKIEPLTNENYNPDGSTAMFDCIGTTIDELQRLPDANDENVSFLIIIISDGEENSSRVYNASRISELVTSCEKTNRWTFAYVGANQDLKDVSKMLNINVMNTLAFAATVDGYSNLTGSMLMATGRYYGARSAGLTSVSNMFDDSDAVDNSKKNKEK